MKSTCSLCINGRLYTLGNRPWLATEIPITKASAIPDRLTNLDTLGAALLLFGRISASQSISVLGNTLEHSINMTGINVGIYYAVFDINGAKRITKKIIKQ